jgi:hypothetical protein
MNKFLGWAARYPVRAMAAAQAVLAALTPVLPAGVTTAVLGVMAAALGIGVHQVVTPVATATEVAARAAAVAAELVARNLGPDTAGPEGTVSMAAGRVVDNAVAAVLPG